ncbi:MAG: ABC transporter permease [Acidobacteriota bacterium]
MPTLWADLRYAVRMLRKSAAFTAVAVAALALGIGANTAIFTVVNAVLLNPLPYPQPDLIMKLGRKFTNGVGYSNSIPKYFAWRRNQAFDAMALYDFGSLGMNLGTSSPPDQIKAAHVSAEYFKVFGGSPVTGRGFTDTEDLPKGPQAAVITYGLWQSRFGGDRGVIGRTVLLNGSPFPVVGVLPPGFIPQPEAADVLLPMQADPDSTNQGHYLSVAGRLKPGVTQAVAQAQLTASGEQFRRDYPKWMDANEGVAVVPMREAMVGDVRPALLILSGAVALVLLIACANVASLLLARASVRQRELAIRGAVGATRMRVVRQMLTESMVLAALGGVFGFALGAWGVRELLALVPGNLPRLTDAAGNHASVPLLDWQVAAFTMGVALLTGLLFGTFPALQASRADLSSHLKESSGRSGTALRHNRVRSMLVVSEVALALVLLVGAALLIRTFAGLQNAKSGIEPRGVLTLQTSLAGSNYATTVKVDTFSTQAVQRIEALPGVEAAASAIVLPIQGGVDLPFAIAGKPPAKGDYNGDEQWRSVSPHYFQVFRIPLLRGRSFSETDTGNASRVVIINEAMAKRYWKSEEPIGQVITIGHGLGPQFEDPPRQIVGIVGTVRENGLKKADQGVMYIPQSQVPEGITALSNSILPLSWAVRTATGPMTMRAPVERELWAVDGQLPISRERTMEQVVADTVSRQSFNMLLLSIFAGVALVLAAIGIYGLMSYAVEQRTQELGIRMALGADRSHVLRLVMAQGVKLAVGGVSLGLALAWALTRLISSLLFGVKASDPTTFGLVAAILAAVALAAAYVPARRATTIDPMIALRYE